MAIGPTISDIGKQGIQTLRDANEGKLAMDAPPIQPMEPSVPQVEAPEPGSYAAAIQEQREAAPAPDIDIERSR